MGGSAWGAMCSSAGGDVGGSAGCYVGVALGGRVQATNWSGDFASDSGGVVQIEGDHG